MMTLLPIILNPIYTILIKKDVDLDMNILLSIYGILYIILGFQMAKIMHLKELMHIRNRGANIKDMHLKLMTMVFQML